MLATGSQRPLIDIPPGIAYFNTAYNPPLLNPENCGGIRSTWIAAPRLAKERTADMKPTLE